MITVVSQGYRTTGCAREEASHVKYLLSGSGRRLYHCVLAQASAMSAEERREESIRARGSARTSVEPAPGSHATASNDEVVMAARRLAWSELAMIRLGPRRAHL